MTRYTIEDEINRLGNLRKRGEISEKKYNKLISLLDDSKTISEYAKKYPRDIPGRRFVVSKAVDFEEALSNVKDFDPEDYTEAELVDVAQELGVDEENEQEFLDAVEKLAIKNMKERIGDSDVEQMNRIAEGEYERAKEIKESPVKKYLLGEYGGKDYIEGKTGKAIANAVASGLATGADFVPPVNPVTAGVSYVGGPTIRALQKYINADEISPKEIVGDVVRNVITGKMGTKAMTGLAKSSLGNVAGGAIGSGKIGGKAVDTFAEKYPKTTLALGLGATRQGSDFMDVSKTDEAIKQTEKEYENAIKNTIDRYKDRWEKAESGDDRYIYSIPSEKDSQVLQEAYKKWRGER